MLHKNMPAGERHAPWSWEYPDAAARTGATGFVATDVGKVALQSDNGTGWVLMSTTPTWQQLGSATVGRELLTADRTYYVAPTGSDSNNGLSAGAPFLTIQKAVDVAKSLDFNGQTVTIKLADGTYTVGAIMRSITGDGTLLISGNEANPSAVVISTNGPCFFLHNVLGKFAITGVRLQTSGSGDCINVTNAFAMFGNIHFGDCAGAHILLDAGGRCDASSAYSIVGSAASHVNAYANSVFRNIYKNVTITGAVTFGNAFVFCTFLSSVTFFGTTFTGSASGKKYDLSYNGTIRTASAGVSYLPGSTAGTITSGGQYA